MDYAGLAGGRASNRDENHAARLALIERMDRNSLVTMVTAGETVRNSKEEQEHPTALVGGFRGADLASEEDIRLAREELRPTGDGPEMPRCHASDIEVPKTQRDVAKISRPELWEQSQDKELFGLLDAGTFGAT